MSAVFWKMSGSGNDFVMLDGRITTPAEWSVERIVAACDRRQGIGADGLVILTPEGGDRVRMAFFNSDGSRAAMCGNAALCSTRLAARLELADSARMTLVADAGEYRTRCVGEGDLAELHFPDTPVPEPVAIPLLEGEEAIALGVVGVPHLVTRVGDLAAVDLPSRGRTLRHHPAAGAAGANANFVARTTPSMAPGGPEDATWAIRTYERGVEGETLACGTGTVAAGLTLAAAGLGVLPLRFRSASGRLLTVTARLEDGMAREVWLCGEGRLVFSGVWRER